MDDADDLLDDTTETVWNADDDVIMSTSDGMRIANSLDMAEGKKRNQRKERSLRLLELRHGGLFIFFVLLEHN